MKVLNLASTKNHISKYEDDKNNPTVWEIGCLDEMAAAIIDDMSTEYEIDKNAPETARAKTTFNYNKKNFDILRLGLKGFQNLIHPETGKEVKFETVATARFGKSRNVVSDSILMVIPRKVRDELAEEIKKLSGLSEEQEKN